MNNSNANQVQCHAIYLWSFPFDHLRPIYFQVDLRAERRPFIDNFGTFCGCEKGHIAHMHEYIFVVYVFHIQRIHIKLQVTQKFTSTRAIAIALGDKILRWNTQKFIVITVFRCWMSTFLWNILNIFAFLEHFPGQCKCRAHHNARRKQLSLDMKQ